MRDLPLLNSHDYTPINVLEYWISCIAIEDAYALGIRRVHVLCDNISAVSWLSRRKHKSIVESSLCNSLEARINKAASHMKIEISHCPGVLNSEADSLSR